MIRQVSEGPFKVIRYYPKNDEEEEEEEKENEDYENEEYEDEDEYQKEEDYYNSGDNIITLKSRSSISNNNSSNSKSKNSSYSTSFLRKRKASNQYLNIIRQSIDEMYAMDNIIRIHNKNFIITRQIDYGGFSSVFEVREMVTGTAYALKVMFCAPKLEACENKILVFENEIDILRSIKNVPYMIQIVEDNTDEQGEQEENGSTKNSQYDKINSEHRDQGYYKNNGQCFSLSAVNISPQASIEWCQYRILLQLADMTLNDYVNKLQYDYFKSIFVQKNKKIPTYNEVGTEILKFKKKRGLSGSLVFNPILLKSIAQDLLRCISSLHSIGYIHADLKPPNFLIVKGQIVLADFGISKKIETLLDYGDNEYERLPNINKSTGKMQSNNNLLSKEEIRKLKLSLNKNKKLRPKIIEGTLAPLSGSKEFMAPELIIQTKRKDILYTKAVDIWAFGRIMMYFIYGKSVLDLYYGDAMKDFWDVFPQEYETNDESLNNFLKLALNEDPFYRATVEKLLSSEYLQSASPDLYLAEKI